MRDFVALLPEIMIVLTLGTLLLSEITYHGERWRLVSWTGLFGLGAALIQTLIAYRLEAGQILSSTYALDGFAIFFKILGIVAAAVTLAAVFWMDEIVIEQRVEAAILVLAGCLGLMISAAAVDLLLGAFGILLANASLALLAGFHKNRMESVGAAIKHWYQTVFVFFLLAFGFSILFRYSGSLNIYEIERVILSKQIPPLATSLAFSLIAMGVSYQIAAFPFGFGIVDVVGGAPTPVGGYLLTVGRLAGLAVGVRFLISIFTSAGADEKWVSAVDLKWNLMLAAVAGVTLVCAGVLSLVQTSAKRLVGFLVMVETGNLLIGLAVLDRIGVNALLFLLIPHVVCTLGAFGALTFFRDRVKSDQFVDLKQMLLKYPFHTTILCIFLLGVAGSPPMPNFLGRFVLWEAAMRNQLPALAMAGVGSWILSLVATFRFLYTLIGDVQHVSAGVTTGLSLSPIPSSAGEVLGGDRSRSSGADIFSGQSQIQSTIESARLHRGVYLVVLLLPILASIIFAEEVVVWAGRSLGFIFW